MNKQLYIKVKNKFKELQKLSFELGCLEKFINEKENTFRREESKTAINKIKEYLILKHKELNNIEKEYKELMINQIKTCKHEISIKRSNSPSFYCIVCGKNMGDNQKEIPNLSIDVTKDYEVYYIIEKQFETLLSTDEDILKSITKLLETLQYERNIKILRR